MYDFISKREALAIWNEWSENGYQIPELSGTEKKIRSELEIIHRRHISLLQRNKLFEFDVKYAIDLHKVIDSKGFSSLRIMTDDGFWRYLSLIIVPDIVAERHGYKPDYFFSKPNRVWLKSIWWLIYLAWQGTYEKTESALLSGKFSTDTTVAMCERTGLEGTNIELYRTIIRKAVSSNNFSPMDIRRVMKLNTVKALVVEPTLFNGGIEGYVNSLFEDLNLQ